MNGFQVRHISWKFALFLGLLSLFGHAEAAQVDQIPMAHEIGSYLAKGSRAAWDEVLRDYPSAKFRNVHAFLSQKSPDSDEPFWYLYGEVNAKNVFSDYSD